MSVKKMIASISLPTLVISTIITALCSSPISGFAHTPNKAISIQNQLSVLAQEYGGRLGVFAVNTANGNTVAYHATQRFPVCSTSKAMTVGAILKYSMEDPLLLNKAIHYSKADITKSGYAPITKAHIKTGMTVKDLCRAAVSYSDNNAANLLMAKLGGPNGVTKFARSIGDKKFYLVHWEPQLNTAIPGDKRDTSTPKAMTHSLQKLALGHVLAPKQRKMLVAWLINDTTGHARIRAGVPKNWIVVDKTGTGGYGTTNDIAVIYPPHCKPIVLSVYYTQDTKDAKPNQVIIAKATRDVIEDFSKQDALQSICPHKSLETHARNPIKRTRK